jgi:hypothetical protein
MRKANLLSIVLVTLAITWGTAAAQYNPLDFTVCPEQTCYVACPSGDLSFGFCISYLGEPLLLHHSEVWMKIECTEGCIFECPLDCLDKCAYLWYPACVNTTGCGSGYNWAFRMGGCCTQATISLHLEYDPTPFYVATVAIKTPDFDCDGKVAKKDQNAITGAIGSTEACYDLNCDGIVDATDLAIFNTHMNHACETLVGVEESSWGVIKSMYCK